MNTNGCSRIVASAALVAASLLGSGAAAAQQASGGMQLQTTIMRDDGVSVPTNPSSRRNGFNLFAEEDLAGTSLRLTGIYRYALINAGGLCPFAGTAGDIFNTNCGDGVFFHVTPIWGVGLDDYAKILQAWPDVASMRAPVGFSTPWRITSIAPITVRINAADGQFGQFYSGTTSLTGAGCREFVGTNGAGLPENFTLLAASDCPETWPGTGFGGMRQIPDSVWLQRFQANPATFTWDDYKIPASQLSDKPMGNLTSYGAFSDYNREMLQLYGGVTPRGVAGQPPGERGFPLGIYVRADAWKYDRPSLRDGVFVRWLVVNNSLTVWGTPIDYDKLYMGIDPGYILGGQSPAANNIPGRGLHVAGTRTLSGKCSGSFPRRIPPGVNEACENSNASAHTIMFLKSPLGDLRNKLLTTAGSPFFDNTGSNPERDDTITFNHWRRGGFGAQEQFSWRRSDRALFGLISGNEELWLDGRNFSDFSSGNIWSYFRFSGTDGTQTRANIRYNRFIPGSVAGFGQWDYDEDGVQDTIMVPDCTDFSSATPGCAGLWGDSIAGGFSNQIAGNIGNFLGVGPFKLAAGDTTEFIFYMGRSSESNNDSSAANRLHAAVTSAYFGNYAGASAYPTPTFTASDITLNSAWFRDSTDDEQTTEVRINIKMPSRQDDPFLQSVLDRINDPTDPLATNIRNLNPTLVATVTERMRQNLAQVLVFKTCDGGSSWTTEDDCVGAVNTFRTRDQDGNDIGLGWRPFEVIDADPVTGELDTYLVTDEVIPGREYIYSFVTKTRGLADIVVTTSLTTNLAGQVTSQTFANLRDVFAVDIDTITSSLSPQGPQVVKVYAPASVPAGTIYAKLDTSVVQSPATNRVDNTANSSSVEGQFRMRFGNQFIVRRTHDTVTGARTTTIIRQSVYPAFGASVTAYAPGGANGGAALSPAGPRIADPTNPAVFHFVASADTFTTNRDFTYSSAANRALSTTPISAANVNPKVFLDTIGTVAGSRFAAGYVIAKGTGGTDPFYMAVGSDNTAKNFTSGGTNPIVQNTDDFELAPWYPGFTAVLQAETASPGTRSSNVLRAPGDTADAGVVNSNGVVYSSTVTGGNPASVGVLQPLGGARGGNYRVNWQGDAFGPGGPFNWGTRAQMQPVLDASFAARPTAAFTDTATALRQAIVAAGFTTLGARPLVRARVPFTLEGPGGGPTTLVMVQRHITGNVTDSVIRNSIMLGTNGDTTRVAIPIDVWMPGDSLWAFEDLVMDSTATVGGATDVRIVHDTVINGRTQRLPIQVSRRVLGLQFTLRCAATGNPTRTTCNPIRLGTRGSTGYLPFQNGWTQVLHFNREFDQNSEVIVDAQPTRASALPLTKLDMQRIQVVPNPYVVQSSFDQLSTNRATINNRVRFVNVPQEGTVRIYSISGQLMQQLSWTSSDLVATGNNSPHGDLPLNLRTREGLDLSSGLYLFVMTVKGAQATMACVNPDTNAPLVDPDSGKRLSCENVARGKFVIIR